MKEYKLVFYFNHGYPTIPDVFEEIDVYEYFAVHTEKEAKEIYNDVKQINEAYDEWLINQFDTGWFKKEEVETWKIVK